MSSTLSAITGLFYAAAGRGQGSKNVYQSKNVEKESNFMEGMYDKRDENIGLRKSNAQKFVDSFYNIATDFYETGWGQSFHFAPQDVKETFRESIIRHEHYMALKMNIKPNDKVLDIGCGIGGPMRNIARFTGANVIGVTINDYQVNRGNEINKQVGLGKQCILKQGDYCKLAEFEDNSFDKVFAIESTCHSPNRCEVYDQVYRVLKPGGIFASYEWVLNADKFDSENKYHLEIKYEIEKGNALPDLITDEECISYFKQSGFEVMMTEDVDQTSRNKGQLPWHHTLRSGCSLENVQHSFLGVCCTHALTWCLETLHLAPKGTYKAHEILQIARDGLVKAGENQTFTPMLLVVAKKPNQKTI